MVITSRRIIGVIFSAAIMAGLLAAPLWMGSASAMAPAGEYIPGSKQPDKEIEPGAPQTVSFVSHEQAHGTIGGACGPHIDIPDRSADAGYQTYSEAYLFRTKIELRFSSNQARIYYTTDGSRPAGSLGAPSGTTFVLAGVYECWYSGQGGEVDVVRATLPPQAAGATVKYVVSAWHSNENQEVFANSGLCPGCVSCTQSGCATVFEYKVIAGTPPATATQPGGSTPSPTPAGGPCSINGRFTDVTPGSPFYEWVECLYCKGAITGYASDNTFRPNALATRGQIAKIVALAFGFGGSNSTNNRFADVPTSSAFYSYVEAMASRDIISGYPCSPGSALEPCDSQGRPYFRPGNNVTRGQLSKIVVMAGQQALGWTLVSPSEGDRSFADVAPDSTFYSHIETAFCHNMIGGYPCGAPGEPCDSQRRAYFREGNNATRGQISKIVCSAVRNEAACVAAKPLKK